MKITLIADRNLVDDGEDSRVLFTRDGAETVEDILYEFQKFMVGAGFTYIGSVGAVDDENEKQYWSVF